MSRSKVAHTGNLMGCLNSDIVRPYLHISHLIA